MGLSGRKVKQRIPNDPRNLTWADDAARFGSNYLSKFGWDSSKGLGAGGDGMKSHIKVSHKLDMLGIGANHAKDPNGIAWKQNKDFENLLRRLNENLDVEQAEVREERVDVKSDKIDEDVPMEGEKKKKRKHKRGEDEEDYQRIKKKKSQETNDEESSQPIDSMVANSVEVVEEVIVEVQKKPIIPRHRAHRARAIAAKNISSKSAVHISEILGVAPTPTTAIEGNTQGKLTSVEETDALGVDKITTSTKSVADYFKDKLLARSSQSTSATPPLSNGIKDESDYFGTPRMGLGASRFQMEVHSEVKLEEATQRMGLSKFSSLMSSSFLASASSFSSFVPPKIKEDNGTGHISEVESDSEPSNQKGIEVKKSKKRSKDVSEEQQEKKNEKKKKKKDAKGKNKEVLTDETVIAGKDQDDGELERKKKKSRKPDSFEEESEGHKLEGRNESSSPTKEKRKSKKEKVDEDGKKSRKDKKTHKYSIEES